MSGRLRATARDRAIDAALALAIVLVVVTAMAAGLGGARRPDAFAYLIAAGLGAVMFIRRTLPVITLLITTVALIAYYAADYPAIGLAVPVAGALYSATEADRIRWAVGTAAFLLAISTFFRLREGDDLGLVLGLEVPTTAAVMAAAIALGDGVRSRRLLRAEMAERAAHAAAQQIEAERLRLAREVHDVLAHTLSIVSLHADVATEAVEDSPDAARTSLRHIRDAAGQAMGDLRRTVSLLRGSDDEGRRAPVGGLDHLDRLAASAASGDVPVRVRIEGQRRELPAVVDTTAYRIVQESLTNVVRHSGARSAHVVLSYLPDRLGIVVTDDGRGAVGTHADVGHGIAGMRERAVLLGGELAAGNRSGGGFRVQAWLPLVAP